MHAAGYVLAGGRSIRMGRDKALLPWNGQPLLLHMFGLVEAAAGAAIVLGPDARYGALCHGACWDDLHPGLGPLGGLETALAQTRADWNLVVSIDIPEVTQPLLRSLLDAASETAAQAVAVRDPGSFEGNSQVHPLCAVYHRNCLPAVEDSIRKGDYRMTNLLKRLTVDYLELPAPLQNLNCPDDWRQAGQLSRDQLSRDRQGATGCAGKTCFPQSLPYGRGSEAS